MQNRKYYGLKESNGSYKIILHESCVKNNKGRNADWPGTKKDAIEYIDSILTEEKKNFLSDNYKIDEKGYFLSEKLDDLPQSKYYGVKRTQNKKKYYIRIPKKNDSPNSKTIENFLDEKSAAKYLVLHMDNSKKKFLSKKYKKDHNRYFLKEKLPPEQKPASIYYGVTLTENKKKYRACIPVEHRIKAKNFSSQAFDKPEDAATYVWEHLSEKKKTQLNNDSCYTKDNRGFYRKKKLSEKTIACKAIKGRPYSLYFGVSLTENKKKYKACIQKRHTNTKEKKLSKIFKTELEAAKFILDNLNREKNKFLNDNNHIYPKDKNGYYLNLRGKNKEKFFSKFNDNWGAPSS